MSDVASAANNISAFISSESLKLFLGVLVPGIMKYALLGLRKFFDIQPAEKIAVTEKRSKVLAAISGMMNERLTDAGKNTIKALYETIGMFYPLSINERLLTFLRDNSLSYDDRDFRSFIKAPLVQGVESGSVSLYNVRYRRERKQRVLFSGISFLILFAAFMLFAGLAKNSTGPEKTFFIVMAMAFYLLNFAFVFFIMNEFERSRRARQFYKKFAPWLRQKIDQHDAAAPSPEAGQRELPSAFSSTGLTYRISGGTAGAVARQNRPPMVEYEGR
ncbi:Uncharacterised protein [Raoultella terrigena]|nr:Uncharacterised protein [Raoultella terrigena]